MVDNLVRHKNGEPFYVRGEDGILVPNPTLKGASPNGKFEGELAKAATVFTTTPQYPKGKTVSAQYVRGEGDMLVLNQATQSSNEHAEAKPRVRADPEWVQYAKERMNGWLNNRRG